MVAISSSNSDRSDVPDALGADATGAEAAGAGMGGHWLRAGLAVAAEADGATPACLVVTPACTAIVWNHSCHQAVGLDVITH